MSSVIPFRAPEPSKNPLVNGDVECALLGTLLTKPSLLAALPDGFHPDHYAFEGHADIHRVLVEVGRPGVPAAVLVSQALGLNDREQREYIAKLLMAPVGYTRDCVTAYAGVVTDLYRRRRLVALAEEMRADAYATTTDGSACAAVSKAMVGLDELMVTGIQGRKSSSLDEAIDQAIAKADQVCARGGTMAGLSTGFPSIDHQCGGLEDGTLTILAGRPGTGKAQPLNAKVLLSNGVWARMGDLCHGDSLASIDGEANRVMAIHPRGNREVFKVTLSDGRSTKVCGDHLWQINYRDWSGPRIMSTIKLREMLTKARYQRRLSLPTVTGEFGGGELLLDPYVLGALLGDGSFRGSTVRLTSADPELVEEVQVRLGASVEVRRVVGPYAYSLISRGVSGRMIEDGSRQGNKTYSEFPHLGRRKFWPKTVYPVQRALIALGLAGLGSEDKFIPPAYLVASRQDRLDMLRGLMDTDGTAGKEGAVSFSSSSLALSEGVQTLVRSLGGLCSIRRKKPSLKIGNRKYECLDAWHCNIRHPQAETFFLLKRKSERATRIKNMTVRSNVTSVEPCGVEDTQCITVTHPSRLYVTDDFIVTHNSSLGNQIAVNVARQGVGVLEIALEMSAAALGRRTLSAYSGVPASAMRDGRHGPYVERLIQCRRELNALPMTIEDGGGLTAGMIAIKARAAQRKHGLGLIMVDHLHIMASSEVDARQGPTAAMTKISGQMKQMSKEFGCPVLLLAQLNRGVENRDDKRPGMADLRQSGAIEQDADNIAFLYRQELYLKNEPERTAGEGIGKFEVRLDDFRSLKAAAHGKADLIFDKVREGQTGTVKLRFNGETTSFSELCA